MDKVLIRTITERIVADSRRFDMSLWASNDTYGVAPCGTTFCFAGETVASVLPEVEFFADFTFAWQNQAFEYASVARVMLDLTPSQADRLFYVRSWPEQFRDAYAAARYGSSESIVKRRARMADILAKRVEHFIKTNGRE